MTIPALLLALAAQAESPPGATQTRGINRSGAAGRRPRPRAWRPGCWKATRASPACSRCACARRPARSWRRTRTPARTRDGAGEAVGIGFGTDYDPTWLRLFRAGGYYVNPAGVPHYVGFAQDSVVQLTGHGPWTLEFLSP